MNTVVGGLFPPHVLSLFGEGCVLGVSELEKFVFLFICLLS